MKNLLSKMGHFFEAHVEKLVLIISLLICFWLLVTCVAISPNRVEYGEQKFSPASVDDYIYTTQIDPVRIIVNGEPRPMEQYESRLDGYINPNDPVREGIKGPLDKGFMSLFTSPIGYIDDNKHPPTPRYSTTTAKEVDKRAYPLPEVGPIDNIDIERIRAAAYVPQEPLREDLSYTEAKHTLDDVDIVTVQGTFNMALLVYKFQECFAGEDLPEAWRDPVLAKPVFAAVHLQRQRQLDNGQWNVWEDVPRCGTEQHRELFRIIEEVDKLPPGGVKVRLLQYGRPDVMADLLQPLPYEIASPYEAWFPPALHREFLSVYEKQKIQERRANREVRADQDKGTDRRSLRGRGAGTQDIRMRGGDTRGIGAMPGYSMDDTTTRGVPARGRRGRTEAGARMPEIGGRGARRTRRPEMGMEDIRGMGLGYEGDMMEESAIREVYDKLFEIFITPQVDIYQEQEIVFWAHDDSLEPGHTYRYRMRLGVFNPLAGTRQIDDAYKDKENAVILWSEFSEITRPLEVPARQYFFANKYYPDTEVLAVEVAQFSLGYWHIGKFQIKPGEVLGQVKQETSDADNTKNDRRTSLIRNLPGPMTSQDTDDAGMIDYSTGIVWIGAESVDAWLGDSRLRRQPYYQMLYTRNGTDLQRVPIGSSNWPDSLTNVYNEIGRARRESPEAPRAFGSSMEGGVDLFDYRGGTGGAYGIDEFGFGRGG